jgi:hypothetical protein
VKRNFPPRLPRVKGSRPPVLTLYRYTPEGWVISTTTALHVAFRGQPGVAPEASGPTVLVGAHCGYRTFNAAIHELVDLVEGNLLPAPADHRADLEDDAGDAA